MKQFTILISLLIQIFFAFGQIPNDDQNFFNYTYDKSIIKSNKVKTVTIELSFKDGKISAKSIFYFDKNGLLTKQSVVDTSGKLLREFFFLTNSYGDLIYTIQNDYEFNQVDTVKYFKSYLGDKLIKDSSSVQPISYNYEYSMNGKIFKTVIVSNFGLGNYRKRVTINKFDSLNRISNSIETIYQNVNDTIGIVFSDRDYFYSKNGRIESEVEKLNGKNSWMANKGSIKYSYDQNGNLKEILRDNADSCSFIYNDKGLITKKIMYLKFGSDDFIETETKIEAFDKFSYTFR